MKAFVNQNARTLDEAVTLAQEALRDGRSDPGRFTILSFMSCRRSVPPAANDTDWPF